MKKTIPLGVLTLLPFAIGLICLGFGRYQIPFGETVRVLLSPFTGQEVTKLDHTVIFTVRLPRILMALAIGMGLAVSGSAFQSMFSNPLATPDTLGVASGASFGAALGLLFGQNLIIVQLMALIMGMLSLALTYSISASHKGQSILMVVLAGMVVSSLFQALVSFIKFVADPQDTLPTITYWLMGSMSGATYRSLLFGLPFILLGTATVYLLRWRLNVISLQEDESKSLGGRVKLVRMLVMVSATLITASAVSLCGQVGWVGLLIPHIGRMLYGSNNTKVIPASILLGSTFMVIIDTVARSAVATELPLSILTALIGAPFFIFLLKKRGGTKL